MPTRRSGRMRFRPIRGKRPRLHRTHYGKRDQARVSPRNTRNTRKDSRLKSSALSAQSAVETIASPELRSPPTPRRLGGTRRRHHAGFSSVSFRAFRGPHQGFVDFVPFVVPPLEFMPTRGSGRMRFRIIRGKRPRLHHRHYGKRCRIGVSPRNTRNTRKHSRQNHLRYLGILRLLGSKARNESPPAPQRIGGPTALQPPAFFFRVVPRLPWATHPGFVPFGCFVVPSLVAPPSRDD